MPIRCCCGSCWSVCGDDRAASQHADLDCRRRNRFAAGNRLTVCHSVAIQTKKYAPARKQDGHDRNRSTSPSRQCSTECEQSKRDSTTSQKLGLLPDLLEARGRIVASPSCRNDPVLSSRPFSHTWHSVSQMKSAKIEYMCKQVIQVPQGVQLGMS